MQFQKQWNYITRLKYNSLVSVSNFICNAEVILHYVGQLYLIIIRRVSGIGSSKDQRLTDMKNDAKYYRL